MFRAVRKGVQDAAVKLLTNVETAQLAVFLNVLPSLGVFLSERGFIYSLYGMEVCGSLGQLSQSVSCLAHGAWHALDDSQRGQLVPCIAMCLP